MFLVIVKLAAALLAVLVAMIHLLVVDTAAVAGIRPVALVVIELRPAIRTVRIACGEHRGVDAGTGYPRRACWPFGAGRANGTYGATRADRARWTDQIGIGDGHRPPEPHASPEPEE